MLLNCFITRSGVGVIVVLIFLQFISAHYVFGNVKPEV